MHEEEQAHHSSECNVRHDHQAALGEAVDHETAQWRNEAHEREDEEHEPRGARRSGQRLHPDRKDHEHHPVAEHRERLAGQQQADVRAREELPHRY